MPALYFLAQKWYFKGELLFTNNFFLLMGDQNNGASSAPMAKKKTGWKKLLTSKLFWIILVILIIGGYFAYGALTKKPVTEYTTEEAKIGTLTQTVSATGKVESADDISLNFKNSGKLVYLKVKEGDRVNPGDIIAKLDSTSATPIVSQYRANLRSARADLASIQAGASAQDLDVSRQQVIKAQNDLDNLKSDANNQINTLLIKNIDSISGSITVGQIALDKIYNDLINTETTAGIAVNNSGLKEKVTADYYLATVSLKNSSSAYLAVSNSKTSAPVVAMAGDLRLVLLNMSSLLDEAFNLSDSIIVKSSYPQASKDIIKLDMSTQKNNITATISALQLTTSNLANGINSYDSQIKTAENNLAISRSQLSLKQAAPRSFQIESAQARVDLAMAQLNKALADLSDYSLVSPIVGVITKVNFKLGEQTSQAKPVIQMLSTEKYQIKIDIPESDITKINVGNKVYIKLDAFGSDHVFSGTITFIDPAQTVIQDVVYYKTTVSFDVDTWNVKIKPGMTADTTINTAKKENVLYVPQRAVKIRETTLGEPEVRYVEILVNGTEVQQKNVTIGLRGDGGLVEIISGLEEGEKVITFKK